MTLTQEKQHNSKPSERARGQNIASVQEEAGKDGFPEERAFELDLGSWEGMGHVDMRKGEYSCEYL